MTRRLRGFWIAILMAAIALIVLLILIGAGTLSQFRGTNPEIDFSAYEDRDGEMQPTALAQDAIAFRRSLGELNDPYGLWLSGYPSYASFTVPLPSDAPLQVGRLVLEGDQTVVAGANALLRLSLNGVRVNEYPLREGQRSFLVQYPVDPRFFAGSQLRVSLMLDGDIPHGLCNDDRSLGASIRLVPDTGLYGSLTGDVTTVRDAMALMPSKVVIAAPIRAGYQNWFELAAVLGARLMQNGYSVSFDNLDNLPGSLPEGTGLILVGDLTTLQSAGFTQPPMESGLSSVSVWKRNKETAVAVTEPDQVAATRFLASSLVPVADAPIVAPEVMAAEAVTGSSVSLSDLGADMSVVRVSERRSWRLRYGLRDLPSGRIPQSLNVVLSTAEEDEEGGSFVVEVELNGLLIGTQRIIAGDVGNLEFELPPTAVKVSNEMILTVRRDTKVGGCLISRSRVPVQLLSDSSLRAAPAAARVRGFPDLPGVFANGMDVILPPGVYEGRPVWVLDTLANLLASFLPYDHTPDFTWSTYDQPTEMPRRPFLALDHLPTRTPVPVLLADGTLRVQGSRGKLVDVGALRNISLVQIAHTDPPMVRDPQTGDLVPEVPSVSGIVALRIGDAPRLGDIDFGWQTALVVPKPGEAVEIGPDGRIARNTTMRELVGKEEESDS